AVQNPQQRRDFLSRGRQLFRRQTQDFVPRPNSRAAMSAMIIGAKQADVTGQANDVFVTIAHETRIVLTVRTDHARPLVPPFFRSLRAVSMACAASLWDRSRISNS